MNNRIKILEFINRELAYQLETEISYNKHLQDDLNTVDDFAIAIDKANDTRVLNQILITVVIFAVNTGVKTNEALKKI